ncbi:RING finger protein 10 isoform X2 [Oryza brachyantha]|uniref:RING finger protein 10 isoform X2 n=1 Tax=Oryza brachyantha TaxID=4533 RepID=UPI001AD9EC04|nr:RING finger protein 10 isoform X2 [Oryza brachyantha]
MSISPPESTRGSQPLAPRPSNPSPGPRHGNSVPRRGRRSPTPAAGPVSPHSPGSAPRDAGGSGASSGSMVPATRECVDSSQKVVGFRISGEENYDSYTQEVGNFSECHSSEHGSSCSAASNGTSGQATPQRPELMESLKIDQSTTNSSGNGTQPRGPKTYPSRKQRKIRPYNKDLFLQANFKFVVLDTGSYQMELMDPDKMLPWEDIVCVRYYSPCEVQCPICLESPLCPQITSCGHIYCFPCILRYLLMGKEDCKGDSWKKCPLCFMMISAKELYTIYITQVQHFHVGDNVTFSLLSRSKNSLTPTKNLTDECPSIDEDDCNAFSKFILTSDVELSVREAKSDLINWLHMADLGLVDDLEKLPYVSTALEQLEERMKYWSEYRNYSVSPPLKESCSPGTSSKLRNLNSTRPSRQNSEHKLSPLSDEDIIAGVSDISISPESNKIFNKRMPSKIEERCMAPIDSNEKDTYNFYQVSDGQHLILHPLNMKCLINHYGSSDMLPPRIHGKILELETVTQSETTRKRYRYLSHFSLTTTFQFCEIDLGDMLPPSSLAPFMDEIKKRGKQRKQTAKKEERDRVKAEVAAAAQASAMRFEHLNFSHSSGPHGDFMFSLDDFEALGNNPGPSTSPPASERKLFSDVTRLGFASAQDSPPLRVETGVLTGKSESTGEQGPAATSALSFASIISSTRAADNSLDTHKPNGVGKKGKKPTKVLLSTGGGRRY